MMVNIFMEDNNDNHLIMERTGASSPSIVVLYWISCSLYDFTLEFSSLLSFNFAMVTLSILLYLISCDISKD